MAQLRSSSAAQAQPQAHDAAGPADRRTGFADDALDGRPPADAPSNAMRLLAEVERLQAELLAMRAKMAELEATADVDPLLNIFNRRGFLRELDRALAYVKRYGTSAALVYLDLDRFKPVNDIHGHAAGDAVLQAVAATLTTNVRASDTVARLGGDEFVALLWNLDEPKAIVKAAALERKIAETNTPWDATRLAVGASAGVTMLGAADQAAEVLGRADHAMYARKATRRTGGAARTGQAMISGVS
jgi:diguanylate cyclase (GGDEF)-like protein